MISIASDGSGWASAEENPKSFALENEFRSRRPYCGSLLSVAVNKDVQLTRVTAAQLFVFVFFFVGGVTASRIPSLSYRRVKYVGARSASGRWTCARRHVGTNVVRWPYSVDCVACPKDAAIVCTNLTQGRVGELTGAAVFVWLITSPVSLFAFLDALRNASLLLKNLAVQ